MLNQLLLSGVLDISQAVELKRQLHKKMGEASTPLTIDLSAVLSVDTAIVQLLLAAKLALPSVTFSNCSDEVLEQFDRLGAMRLLI